MYTEIKRGTVEPTRRGGSHMGVAWRPGGPGSSVGSELWLRWGLTARRQVYLDARTRAVASRAAGARQKARAGAPKPPRDATRSAVGITAGALALAAQAIGPGHLASRSKSRAPAPEGGRLDITA